LSTRNLINLEWWFSIACIFQVVYALRDGEVFFGAVLLDNEEASSLIELWVWADYKMIEILGLGCKVRVKLQYLVHEVFLSLVEFLIVFSHVEDGSRLGLDLI
jgi:hypothetical protein